MAMTTDDYGKRINAALRAVEQMHSDCSRLLLDFDRVMEGWKPIYGNFATRDLTYNVRAQRWMAEGVYRLYSHASLPSVVRGLTICFIGPDVEEPVLLVAEIKYSDSESEIKTICREWDMWQVYFDWAGERTNDKVISVANPDSDKRIRSALLVAKPLYSINSLDEVTELMKLVTNNTESKSLAQGAQ
jgi:hypothetical protein